MKNLWSVDVDTLEEFFKLVDALEKDLGRQLERQEREIVFFKLMEYKNIKPIGATELTKKELWSQLVKGGKTILNIDETGYKIIKEKEEDK
jgi:hypothetical protein